MLCYLLNPFQMAKDSLLSPSYLSDAVIMCTELPHLKADEKHLVVVQCNYVSTAT